MAKNKKISKSSNNLVKRDANGRLLPGSRLNPAGQQRGGKHFMTKVKEAISLISEKRGTDVEIDMAMVMIEKVLSGDMSTLKMYWDQTDGKANQSVTLKDDTIEVETEALQKLKDKANLM